jgi:nicotinamidase-related amidase
MSAASAQPSSTPQIPSPLARDQAVMIFVDNQTGLMASVQSLHPEQLKQGMVALRDVAAIYQLPVILTASDPSNPQGPGPMVPELTQAFPQSQVIARTSIGAWDDSQFVASVKATGRHQLIVSGIATDAGVAFTALGAKRAGYEVFVVADASATWSEAAHSAALMRMCAVGVVPVSWIAVAAELQRDWSHPNSEDLAKLLQRNIARWNYIAAGARAEET